MVRHILYPDENNRIYCKKYDEIYELLPGLYPCQDCLNYKGTYRGHGCECVWIDKDFPGQRDVHVYDPCAERERLRTYMFNDNIRLKQWETRNRVAKEKYWRRRYELGFNN